MIPENFPSAIKFWEEALLIKELIWLCIKELIVDSNLISKISINLSFWSRGILIFEISVIDFAIWFKISRNGRVRYY